MNLKQKTLFNKLKKKFAYEVALAKKNENISQDELYESLCLLHYNKDLTDVSNDFLQEYESINPGEEAICILTSIAILLDNIIKSEVECGMEAHEVKELFDSIYLTVSMEKH
jgi:hypothetical protein